MGHVRRDRLCHAELRVEVRREAIRRKVALLEKLNAAARAFGECARLLTLAPRDAESHTAERRLAQGAGL